MLMMDIKLYNYNNDMVENNFAFTICDAFYV